MTSCSSALLAVEDLGMRFGAHILFDRLSFSFDRGAVALVGGNGAGKSTMISLLSGIVTPDTGRIAIRGHDIATHPGRAKQHLAYVPDESVAYPFMRGNEFLDMVDALRGRRDAGGAAALTAGFGLTPHMGKRFDAMSLGTRKKFMLVAGLMSPADVLLMDEPTNGIDAGAKRFLIDLIRNQSHQRLFFFSTHDSELIDETGARLLRLAPTAG